MTLGLLFWLLMLLVLVLGLILYPDQQPTGPYYWHRAWMSFLVWILLALLGYKVFGWPIQR